MEKNVNEKNNFWLFMNYAMQFYNHSGYKMMEMLSS